MMQESSGFGGTIVFGGLAMGMYSYSRTVSLIAFDQDMERKNINLRHDDKLIARKVELLDRLAENDL